MPVRTYENFDVLVERADAGYRARVVASPAGQTTSVPFTVPFDEMLVENLVLQIGRGRRHGVRGVRTANTESLTKRVGGALFDALFTDDLHTSLISSMNQSEANGNGLRLRLRMTDCPELANLPWEYLHDRSRNRFLALSEWTPVIRFLDQPGRIRPLAVTAPLKVLVVIASPHDEVALDADAEWARISDAVQGLVDSGRIELRRLNGGTISALQQALRTGEFHVLHFVGHGGFDEHSGDGMLLFEAANGLSNPVSGQNIGVLLHDHRTLRLAILNSCEGARGGVTDAYAGTAQSLIQQGIPAVVAMQFEITDEAAIVFAQNLYEAVAAGYPLDAAVGDARKAVFNSSANTVEWGTPVLYLRAPDGQIFDVTQPAPGAGQPIRVVEPAPQPGLMSSLPEDPPIIFQRSPAPPAAARIPPRAGRIAAGVSAVTDLIRRTFGPDPRPVVIHDAEGKVAYSTDALQIANSFATEDADERIGADIMTSLVAGVRREWHDGAATAAIVAESLIRGATAAVGEGANPIKLAKDLQASTESACAGMSQLVRPVETKEQIAALAALASADTSVGDLIAEAMDKVGKDGVITVEESNTFGLELELTEGMSFDTGYVSPNFVTDPVRSEAVLDDPYLLFVESKLSDIKDLLPLLEKVVQSGKPLVVIAADIEGEVLTTLIVNQARGTLKSVAVKAPGFGGRRTAMLRDLAFLTGAVVAESQARIAEDDFGLDYLGRAAKVVVTKQATTIIDAAGDSAQITRRVDEIRNQIENAESDWDREKLQDRLAKLAGGVALIRVGAESESELADRKRRVTDAVHLAQAAVADGIVIGGTSALLAAAQGWVESTGAAVTPASSLLAAALTEPFRQLVHNAGVENPDEMLLHVQQAGPTHGFNAKTGQLADLWASGVLEPVQVQAEAVRAACQATIKFLSIL
jgi:chaperonin GroEL